MRFWICLLLCLALHGTAVAFTADGCGSGKCSDCHSLDVPEATKLLGKGVDRVLRVEFAEVPGFWLVNGVVRTSVTCMMLPMSCGWSDGW